MELMMVSLSRTLTYSRKWRLTKMEIWEMTYDINKLIDIKDSLRDSKKLTKADHKSITKFLGFIINGEEA